MASVVEKGVVQQRMVGTRTEGRSRRVVVFVGLGFLGWAGCAAIIGVGMAVTSLWNALVIHAIGAPVIFGLVTTLYFRRVRHTTALVTAIGFTALVVALDFFAVALLVQRSLDMFNSVLGTWLPFALIFLSTYLTGWSANRRKTGYRSM